MLRHLYTALVLIAAVHFTLTYSTDTTKNFRRITQIVQLLKTA